MTCHLCGGEGKYQNKQGEWLCDTSANRCPVVKEKNSLGLKQAHLDGKMRKGCFTEDERRKSRESLEKKLASMPFEEQAWERQRATVISEQEEKCLHCDVSEWMGRKITLQVDHIDGNNRNNKRENLRALCPNCHSITDTYCGKNINKHNRIPVPDETIIAEIKKGISIRQILINVGLTPKGGNYGRIKKLIALHGTPKMPIIKPIPAPRAKKQKFDTCTLCGKEKLAKAKNCWECAHRQYQKVDWQSIDLKKLLEENGNNICAVARLLGVSDNAVRKHLR